MGFSAHVNTVFDLATNKISNVEPVATVPQLFTNIPEAAFAVEDAGSSVTINGLQAVSYTHLDVYKRQEVLEADIQAAAAALYEALDNLVFRADRTDLEPLRLKYLCRKMSCCFESNAVLENLLQR